MSKKKVKFFCTECGHESLKWLGRCPACDSWNTFTEEIVEAKSGSRKIHTEAQIVKLTDNIESDNERIKIGIEEFDRVLGGGITSGSVILIGGDPGIGKSTLVMQAAGKLKSEVLYVTGEESIRQINIRAKRLGVKSDTISILAETDLDVIVQAIDKTHPAVVIIDSIQTISKSDFDNAPGTITQIRECTAHLMQLAKTKNISIILIGHVTKEGYIAGPKILEHIVDTVLQFEGEKNHSYRILRAQKNRFGSTNEIGIFEMHGSGLTEVKNPSEVFLSDQSDDITGSVITASMEGTRAILLEVQALVTPSHYGNPQRVATGFDYRRLSILLAVLEKRARLAMSSSNVFLNIAGGLRIDEPATDLAICCAIVSSFKDFSIPNEIAIMGEVGLGGEVRGVGNIEKRIGEAQKLGFKKVIIPGKNKKGIKSYTDIEIIPSDNLIDTLELLK